MLDRRSSTRLDELARARHTVAVSRRSPAVSPGLGPLLFECARLLDEIAQAEVNREAGARVLTPALVRLLPHLSVDGVRPTDLARRGGQPEDKLGVPPMGAVKVADGHHRPGQIRRKRLGAAHEDEIGDGTLCHRRAAALPWFDWPAARTGHP